MSVTKTLPGAILETILDRLAFLFLSGAAGNQDAARQAAARMLDAYHPRTEEELRLAASIVSFGFHALEALAQAAAPDMKLARILRLRGSAVSLSREGHKAERRLGQLQTASRAGIPAEIRCAETKSNQPEVNIVGAIDLIQDTRPSAANAEANRQTWTQGYEQRRRDQRIAASLERAEARVASQALCAIAAGRHPVMNQMA